ncbi:MAG TPA: asparagine synthase (glutamine-hydrolyzing) [Gammaproteobacteria bacterium]|nr:asparagine synthase (glutamine-hydrolyzing) [Gammaproteobacteria bacterium]
MCGIAGIIGREAGGRFGDASLARMVRLLHHRGPDHEGVYRGEGVLLGHARLSIIDLEGGDQPVRNEDGRIQVVFNGEIFNYIELREELIRCGHHFYTHSDTEVIVHAYEEYGDEFARHLNGQFAIALWDDARRRLLMLRDRPGIVPFFYTRRGATLLFASEVKALLAGLGESARLDGNGLDQLFTFWSPVSPRTLFEGVRELPPGHMAVFEGGRLDVRAWWRWDYPVDGDYLQDSEEALAARLHDLLVEATRIRLRSDVPVGAYLSGGLDSSVLVSLIHHYGGVPLRTFSIGFEDEKLDEGRYQRELIEHLSAEHSSVQCRHQDIAAGFRDTIWHTESSILRTAPVPMGILSGLVREQGYRVVLTGEGSDEVLGGYDIFKEAKIRRFWAMQPDSAFRASLLRRLYPYLDLSGGRGLGYVKNFFGTGLDQPDLPWFSHIPRWETTARIKTFYADDFAAALDDPMQAMQETLPGDIGQWHPFNRAQHIEARSLMGGYLLCSQGDRMLMKHSVEGRFPFLDHRVIEFARRLPPRLKMKVLNEKYLLKRAMRRYLPHSIVARYKQPYRAPDIPAFFSGATAPEWVEDALAEDALRRAGCFDPGRVAMLLRKIRRGRAIGYKDNMALVGILSTQLWHRLFVEEFTTRVKDIPDTPIPSDNPIAAEV